MLKSHPFLLSLLTFCFIPVVVFAQVSDIKTYQLQNGMKILVQEDHSIPNVAMYIFYKIGSRNERPGTTGISHYFEHMMFNGAKKYGPKQFDVVMEAAGGSNNAYTNRDVTVYQDWFPRSAMELIFDIEADRIEHLNFDPKMIESERGVVASERRTSVEANNFGILNEELWASAFIAHPYQWPVLGWMSDIQSWTLEELKAHFRIGYSPKNATVVVVGDVTGEEVYSLAKRYLEKIPARETPPQVKTKEPEQAGERRSFIKKFAQLPIIMLGYHVPQTAHPDFYALQFLQTILVDGQSSRLYQRLVDKDQIAIDVGGGVPFAIEPTLLILYAQPTQNVEPQKVEAALYDELKKIQSGGVSAQEIQKAKNIILAGFYRNMKTIDGKADALGTYELFFGDYRKLFTASEAYEKVTAEDVKRVANAYLMEKNRTVVTLIPTAEEESKKTTP
jgi:zinc protease